MRERVRSLGRGRETAQGNSDDPLGAISLAFKDPLWPPLSLSFLHFHISLHALAVPPSSPSSPSASLLRDGLPRLLLQVCQRRLQRGEQQRLRPVRICCSAIDIALTDTSPFTVLASLPRPMTPRRSSPLPHPPLQRPLRLLRDLTSSLLPSHLPLPPTPSLHSSSSRLAVALTAPVLRSTLATRSPRRSTRPSRG